LVGPPDREPVIHNRFGKEVETDWVQERDNQLALLDTFFSAVRPEESLCFIYGTPRGGTEPWVGGSNAAKAR